MADDFLAFEDELRKALEGAQKRSPASTPLGMLQGSGRGVLRRHIPSERETQKRIPGSGKKRPRLLKTGAA